MRPKFSIFYLALAVSLYGEQIELGRAENAAPGQKVTDCCSPQFARSTGLFSFTPERNGAEKNSQRVVCANFGGTWQVPENDLTPMALSQGRRCTLFGAFHTAGRAAALETVSGFAYKSGASVVITRTDASGCETKMFATLAYQPDGTMRSTVSGTNGSCGLPVDYAETRIWIKQ